MAAPFATGQIDGTHPSIPEHVMQYRIHGPIAQSRLPEIEASLTIEDPAALVDLDAGGQWLRIATSLPDAAVRSALRRAGCEIDPLQVERVPSECCGGCGG
jgi:hypothetical protein